MSLSNSERSEGGGEAVEKHAEHPKLEKLNRLRKTFNWKFENHRFLFYHEFEPLVRDWKKQLPNLHEIFTKQEMDWILIRSIKPFDPCPEIVEFVIRTGYKDEPDLDEDGKPLLRRTTAVHKIAERLPNGLKIELLIKLFEIYDKFHVNYTDELGYSHFHMACKYGLDHVAEKFLELGQDPNCLVPETGDSILYFLTVKNLAYVNTSIIRLLLKHGADPNQTNEYGLTPLQGICQKRTDRRSVILMLLRSIDEFERTVQLNVRDNEGNTPLHLVLMDYIDKDIVEELLRRGANPNWANARGQTPLHVICEKNQRANLLPVFFDICDKKRQPVLLDVRDNEGNTPLHLATSCGNEEKVESLLRRGADPNLANANGLPPLHIICQRYGNERLLQLVLEINDEIEKTVQIDARDESGNTPLHLAISYGYVEMTELLLKHGADPSQTKKDGTTPLHVICQKNRNYFTNSVISMLLESVNELQQMLLINAQDKWGDTPLHLAVKYCHDEEVELLLKRGANPNLANAKGQTPLHVIFQSRGNDYMLMRFFEICDEKSHPVLLNVRDNEGNTPLHLAILCENGKMVRLLLRRGADPCLANAKGLPPLHLIARRDFIGDMIGIFLSINKERQQTVEIDARDNLGRTALEWAVASCLPLAVKSLLDWGADVSGFVFPTPSGSDNLGGYFSLTKLTAATGLLAIVELLEEKGYVMSRDDALKLMGFFDKYGLYESTDFSASKDVDDLVDSLFEEMAKKCTYMDYLKFVSSDKLYKKYRKSWDACSVLLREKILTKFCRDWALDPFMELIHYRLPILCCEIIVEKLKNKDLFNICLAAAGRSSRQ